MKAITFQKIQSLLKVACVVLSLCVILSAIMLVCRLGRSVQPDLPAIELTFTEMKEPAAAAPQTGNYSFYRKDFKPGFEVVDDKGVWMAETPIEIFKIAYENGQQQVTVNGGEDKVIAPGTGNVYTFTLKNTGNVPLDYTMSTEVRFSDQEYTLPVQVRMKDYNGGYLCGSAEAMEPASALNTVSDSATLAAMSNAVYSLEWEWPFERGGAQEDAYDTLLGDAALDRDLSMTVIIRTHAEGELPDEGPDTGDHIDITLLIIIAVAALAVLAIMVILPRLKKKGEESDAQDTPQNN